MSARPLNTATRMTPRRGQFSAPAQARERQLESDMVVALAGASVADTHPRLRARDSRPAFFAMAGRAIEVPSR